MLDPGRVSLGLAAGSDYPRILGKSAGRATSITYSFGSSRPSSDNVAVAKVLVNDGHAGRADGWIDARHTSAKTMKVTVAVTSDPTSGLLGSHYSSLGAMQSDWALESQLLRCRPKYIYKRRMLRTFRGS